MPDSTHIPSDASFDNASAPLVLQLSNVRKSFQGRAGVIEALTPVSLSVREGQFVVLLGPSGCGKTTLLNIVAGFDQPTSGQVLMDGRPISKPGLDRMVMFQEPALFPWLNAIDNVLFGLRNVPGQSDAQRVKTARHYLDLVGLAPFEKAYIHELSGGMKQRVALARALAPHPRVLLMDEPFSALDAVIREELYGKLQEVLAQTGQTVLFVTHNVREAACLADHVLIMAPRPGRVVYTLDVPLPRPRDLYNPDLNRYAATILQGLRQAPATASNPGGVGPNGERYESTPARLALLSGSDTSLADGI